MELTNRQILIELPEGNDKTLLFSVIALANGWTPTTPKTVEKTEEVTGFANAETRIAEMKAE